MDKDKARERGAKLAIVVIGALWAVIYVLYSYLSRPLGEELASGISLVAGLFAAGVLSPVQNAYANWEARKYCAKNGHVLRHHVAADGRSFVLCDRCNVVMINEHASRDVSRNS